MGIWFTSIILYGSINTLYTYHASIPTIGSPTLNEFNPDEGQDRQ